MVGVAMDIVRDEMRVTMTFHAWDIGGTLTVDIVAFVQTRVACVIVNARVPFQKELI